MNNPLLINVTPFKGLLTESKTKPGVFEVVGIMQRAGQEHPKDLGRRRNHSQRTRPITFKQAPKGQL